MATIKPFKGLRPPKELVEQVQSRPYDVLNSDEARAEAEGNEKILYHIIKPEINFPVGKSEYDDDIYDCAAEEFRKFQEKGWLIEDKKENYYIYAQTMNGKTQYGLVVGAYTRDYLDNHIKKHELTRKDKEDDRMKNVRICKANMEPVFLTYPDRKDLSDLLNRYASTEPEYDFVAEDDGFRHQFWVVEDEKDIELITKAFAEIPTLYIADGHHRTAAAVRVGLEMAEQNPHHTGKEEYNYFLAVCFPASQLTVLDYNRVVKDLNGMTSEEFLKALEKNFLVERMGEKPYRPQQLHEFSLYLDKNWYKLNAKEGTFNPDDPVGVLDVDISSRLILDELLGIKDLRTDKRIDFVGGLRGLEELSNRVDSGEMKMALALYPVTMEQIMAIADSGSIMPPKATWFEPKLRSGLIIHKLF